MKYALKNENGMYVKFKFGHSPQLVDISKATLFNNIVDCVKQKNTVPRKYGRVTPIEVVYSREMLSSLEEIQNVLKQSVNLVDTSLKYLGDKLSELDTIANDLEHFIEFNELNAADGYKVYKIFHETMVQRRKIKDSISEMENMKNKPLSKALRSNLTKKNDRSYQIRNTISKPLFEGKLSSDYKKICEQVRSIQ